MHSEGARQGAETAWDRRRWAQVVAAATAAAALFKLLLAFLTYGTNDVYGFERFSSWGDYLGGDLYKAAWDFNHPAMMIHTFRAMGWLARTTGLWFPFWLKLPAIAADAAAVWLVWRILEKRLGEPAIRWAVLLLAVSPVPILVSGFHGNTDSVMICFLVLAVYLIESGRPAWVGGAAFGLAMSVKVVPLVTVPAVFFYLPNRRSKLVFFASAGAVMLVAWSPFLEQTPLAMVRQVFGYRSIYGHWGLSQLMVWLSSAVPQFGGLSNFYRQFGTYFQLAGITALSFWFQRLENRPSLYARVGLVLFLFLATANGFGVQYLDWLCPWVPLLGAAAAGLYYLTAGAFLFAVYDYWAQGLPWYLADSNRIGDYPGHTDYLQILSWAAVVLMAWVAWNLVTGKRLEAPAWWNRTLRWNRRLITAVVAIAGVVYPAMKVAIANGLQREGRAQQEEALRAIRAGAYVELSAYLCREQRFTDAIAATKQALVWEPNSADAHNNLAAGYAGLHSWDDAIREALEAIRLDPGSQLARNNLAWALQEKMGKAPQIETAGRSAADYLQTSLDMYQAGRFPESIQAAKDALKLQPNMAEAYNNIAAGYGNLRQWDEAIDAAQKALRIKPDFELARNNLLWALEQKRTQAGAGIH